MLLLTIAGGVVLGGLLLRTVVYWLPVVVIVAVLTFWLAVAGVLWALLEGMS